MTKILFTGAFILGALAITWIGRIFLGADTLGLGVTILIGVVYAIGTWELLLFRRATGSLNASLGALAQPVDDLYQWLLSLDPSLQNSVRLRIDGERNGLPAPVVTPYLVGLLVMLGLLGTFVGMVDTLKGAVVALEGNSELEAIRAGLAAPIEGLGLAFGTSVAGVAASAMLGLLSTISRRERLQVSQLLDTKIGGELRDFSGAHRQQLAFQAIQDQAHTLPQVAEELSGLASKLEQMGESMNERLFTSQEQFQTTVTQLYRELNESVDQSLKTSLVESAQLISSSVQPVVEETLSKLHQSTLETQQHLTSLSQDQLSVLADSSEANNVLMRESLDANLAQQSSSTRDLISGVNSAVGDVSDAFQARSKALLESFTGTSEQWADNQQQQAVQFNATVSEELGRLRDSEDQRGSAAVERLSGLEASVTTHLASLGQALEEPMTRLIETASQTPKAAADVIETLRGEMTKNFERDNDLLSERTRLMEQLDTLSKTLEKSSIGQREAIDLLIERSAQTLSKVGDQFGERLEGESSKLADVVDHFANSSTEIASLGDAFNAAVMQFSDSNSSLIENLTRIESALEKSSNRSDEQLAYYVAQAREIIDHNMLSHQEIVEAMRTQQGTQGLATGASS